MPFGKENKLLFIDVVNRFCDVVICLVTGLLERMTLDRIMPKFFLKKNNRGSSYRIIIVFLLLSTIGGKKIQYDKKLKTSPIAKSAHHQTM